MNRSQIRELVVQATGRTDKTSLINSAIDLAVQEISAQRLWSDLLVEASVSTSANTSYVTLASAADRITEVRVFDGSTDPAWPLKVRDKSWLVGKIPNFAALSTGEPTYGYLEGRKLYLVPIPDGAYTIYYSYYRQHPSLTSDSSSVLIRGTDRAVAAYASFWVWQSLENHEQADKWLLTYFALLNSAKRLDGGDSVVKTLIDSRGDESPISTHQYWLDPFVKEPP